MIDYCAHNERLHVAVLHVGTRHLKALTWLVLLQPVLALQLHCSVGRVMRIAATQLLHAPCLLILLQRLLAEQGEIHLSALGMAVSTMVSIAEILKKDGLAVETSEQQLLQLLVLSQVLIVEFCSG
eukprot:GHRQ01039961.1.p1 GENE.GHRQ01039961.1~~GHRQ01039961.1.p1  ORF type:complete len:126 (-),score=21.58 GHRQ01039961.1:65-442(-)